MRSSILAGGAGVSSSAILRSAPGGVFSRLFDHYLHDRYEEGGASGLAGFASVSDATGQAMWRAALATKALIRLSRAHAIPGRNSGHAHCRDIRYSVGDRPTILLKVRSKCDRSLNPTVYATSLTVKWRSASKALARVTRTR